MDFLSVIIGVLLILIFILSCVLLKNAMRVYDQAEVTIRASIVIRKAEVVFL